MIRWVLSLFLFLLPMLGHSQTTTYEYTSARCYIDATTTGDLAAFVNKFFPQGYSGTTTQSGIVHSWRYEIIVPARMDFELAVPKCAINTQYYFDNQPSNYYSPATNIVCPVAAAGEPLWEIDKPGKQCRRPKVCKVGTSNSVNLMIGYVKNPVNDSCGGGVNCSPPAKACGNDNCRFDVSGITNVYGEDTGSGFTAVYASYNGNNDGTSCIKPSEPPPPVCPEGQAPGQVNGTSVCVPTGSGSGSGGDGDGSGSGGDGSGDGSGSGGSGDGSGGSGDGSGGSGDGSGDGSGSGTGGGTSGGGSGSGGDGGGPSGEVDPGGTGTVGGGNGSGTGTGGGGSGSSDGGTGNTGGDTGGNDGSDGEEEGEKCPAGDQTLGCAKFGEVPGEDGIGRSTFNLSFLPENLLGVTGTCPQDKTIQLNGQTIKMIDMQWACNALSTYVKPVFILIALITATFIVSGGTGRPD